MATKTAKPAKASKPVKSAESTVYKVIEVVGTSRVSWADAAKNAIKTVCKSLRDLRVAEVSRLDVKVSDTGDIVFRAKMSISFKYHDA